MIQLELTRYNAALARLKIFTASLQLNCKTNNVAKPICNVSRRVQFLLPVALAERLAAFLNSWFMLSCTCTLGNAYLHIRKSWEPPAQPTKKFTANRLQFLGIITREYLDQIRPVEKKWQV